MDIFSSFNTKGSYPGAGLALANHQVVLGLDCSPILTICSARCKWCCHRLGILGGLREQVEKMSQLWELLADTGKTTTTLRVPKNTTAMVPEPCCVGAWHSSLKVDVSTGPGRGPCIVLLVRRLVTGNGRLEGHMSG